MNLSAKILIFMVAGAIVGFLFLQFGGYDCSGFLTQTKTMALNMDSWAGKKGLLAAGQANCTLLQEQSWSYNYLVEGLFSVGGTLFINALKMLMVPLVLVSLVCGVSSLADPSKLGRLSLKSIGLYLLTTAIALTLALTLASIFQPGIGMPVGDATFNASEKPPLTEVIINIIPTNPFEAMFNANMLQIIVFAILVGLAITLSGEQGKRISKWFNDVNKVVMELVNIVMRFAPYGVFFLIAETFATFPFSDLLGGLGGYFLLVIVGLILHAILTYSTLIALFARLNPINFFKGMWPAMITAFGTSSSNATLPVTMRCAEMNLGVHKNTFSFTLPLGATINMDGTAIMQGIATLFIAQAYDVDLSMAQLLTVVLTATLASIGTAGVPSVGLILLAGVLTQVNLPVEAIGMILGIDRLLDMTRTAVNISGDAAVTAIVAKSENEIEMDTFNDPFNHSNFDD
ncbi:dicarboxylate/amino acid:cation symporter [Kangiella sediminilitoris]|uniref:Proton/glutamate symport protein n=1 Tax=Kangiella sediminilitoris TaxID=1144748 RepID=A0A1B3B9E4_9GAMM|nr:dicarboxylate/amino acid:cation symporter [Kangiella sediminilitoris]AOE49388.1 proton/glutamate symport protein [Kangiella sediminilitoris]